MSQLNDWVQLLVGALTAATLLFGGFAWVGKRLMRWFERRIKDMADDSREAARQLKTPNGTTVAQYVERTDAEVQEVKQLSKANADGLKEVVADVEVLKARVGALENKPPVIVNVPPMTTSTPRGEIDV